MPHVPLTSWRNESDGVTTVQVRQSISDGSTEASWQFKLFNSVQAVPDSWPARGDMESLRCGHGTVRHDHPIYTNVKYPFPDGRQVPDDNPTGCYERTRRHRCWLAEQQVSGLCRMYAFHPGVQWVGSQDSRLPADLTDYLRAGENVLSVMVMRSDGSYLEARICGI